MPDAPKTYRQLQKAKQGKTKTISTLKRPTTAQMGYGGRWNRLSKLVRARDPICTMQGCERPSEHADHIIPKSRGGQDTMENLRGLCKPCHSRKTALEDGGFGR